MMSCRKNKVKEYSAMVMVYNVATTLLYVGNAFFSANRMTVKLVKDAYLNCAKKVLAVLGGSELLGDPNWHIVLMRGGRWNGKRIRMQAGLDRAILRRVPAKRRRLDEEKALEDAIDYATYPRIWYWLFHLGDSAPRRATVLAWPAFTRA